MMAPFFAVHRLPKAQQRSQKPNTPQPSKVAFLHRQKTSAMSLNSELRNPRRAHFFFGGAIKKNSPFSFCYFFFLRSQKEKVDLAKGTKRICEEHQLIITSANRKPADQNNCE